MSSKSIWNHPKGAGGSRPTRPTRPSRRLLLSVLFAVLLAAGGGAWWAWRVRDGTTPQERTQHVAAVLDAAIPDAAKNDAPASAVCLSNGVAAAEVPYWEVDESQTNGFSRAMQKKWEHRHRPKYKFDLPERKVRAKYRIFRHRSENEIAALLMAKPGASMIGRPNYRGLTEDFMKSCEEPIIVTQDDDEYTAKLKREVKQAKIELRQRMADGERLEQIIEDTRAEYRRLSEYKRMLTKEMLGMIRRDGVTAEDVDAFVGAANKMLDAKGIAPIKMSGITKQWIINNKGEL